MNFWLWKVLLKVKSNRALCRGSASRNWVQLAGIRVRELSKVNQVLYASVILKMGHSHLRRKHRRESKSWGTWKWAKFWTCECESVCQSVSYLELPRSLLEIHLWQEKKKKRKKCTDHFFPYIIWWATWWKRRHGFWYLKDPLNTCLCPFQSRANNLSVCFFPKTGMTTNFFMKWDEMK